MPSFDAASKATTDGATSLTWSHTCSGSNRILIVGTGSNGPSINSVTYNGVGLTMINSRQENGTGYLVTMWYLANPDSGTHDIVVTPSQHRAMECRGMSWTNAEQTDPIGSSNGVSSVGATQTTLSISSTAQWVVMDAICWNNDAGPATGAQGTGQTYRGDTTNATYARLAMSSQSGSPVEAMSWSFTSATNFGFIAAPIKHLSAAPPPAPSPGGQVNYASTTDTQNPAVGTSIQVTVPVDTVNGDILFAVIAWSTGTETLNVIPAGWNTIHQDVMGTANDISMSTFYRTAASEPSSYTWRMTGTGVQNSGFMWRLTGAHATTPLSMHETATGRGGTPVLPSFNTPTNNELLALIVAVNSNESGIGFSVPTGWTSRNLHLSSGSCRHAGWSRLQVGAGATGNITATVANMIAEDPWIISVVTWQSPPDVVDDRQSGMQCMPEDMSPYMDNRFPVIFCGHVNKDAAAPVLIPIPPTCLYDLPDSFYEALPVPQFMLNTPRPGNVASPPGTPQPPPAPVPIPGGGGGAVSTTILPRISLPPQHLKDEAQWKRQTAAWISEANQGHLQNTGLVTLTPNSNTTVVADNRVGVNSFIGYTPRTENAAAEVASGRLVTVPGNGVFSITHNNNAQEDRTFIYTVLG